MRSDVLTLSIMDRLEFRLIAAAAAAYIIGYRHGTRSTRSTRSDVAQNKVIRAHSVDTVRTKGILKAQLMEHLTKRSVVKLAPSSIDGVGVFAVVDIPAGVDPFSSPNSHLCAQEVSIPLSATELDTLPPSVVDLVTEFHAEMDMEDCIAEAAEQAHHHHAAANASSIPIYYGVNATGLATLDASWYLNHSESANVESVEAEEEGLFSTYRTSRVILAGEELLTDYRHGLESMFAKVRRRRSAQAV